MAPLGGRAVGARVDAPSIAMPPPTPVPSVAPKTTSGVRRARARRPRAPRAVGGLGEHEAGGVVVEPHGATERRREIAIERPIVEALQVRVADEPAPRLQEPRRADADAAARARLGLEARDERRRIGGEDVLVGDRRRDAVPRPLAPVVAERDAFDLRAPTSMPMRMPQELGTLTGSRTPGSLRVAEPRSLGACCARGDREARIGCLRGAPSLFASHFACRRAGPSPRW